MIGAATDRAATVTPGASFSRRLRLLGVVILVLVVCFAKPLYLLGKFASGSELYSHILLVPAVSLYLIWLRKSNLPLASQPSPWLALPPALVALAGLAAYQLAVKSGVKIQIDNYLATMTLCFLLLVLSGGFLFLGKALLREIAFPITFLLFAVPFPNFMLEAIEHFLQHSSADVAFLLFTLSGMPVLRQDTHFQLPGFPLEVAPECSGIHSTLVLFITSLVAGNLFLKSTWRRAALTLFVIPLALIRNGFRILVIGQLCVRVSPEMINSYIHRKGGPIFFLLSLVPFILLLIVLQRSEGRRKGAPKDTIKAAVKEPKYLSVS